MKVPEKKLGFGFMRMPLLNKEDQTSIDLPQVEEMVDLFFKRGFTYCDTAWMYHKFASEETVGKAVVDRYPRESFTVATKMPDMMLKSADEVEKIYEEQKRKLHVDYFDYYLVHDMNIENYEKAKKFGAIDFLRKKRESGEIRCLGFSIHDTPEFLDQVLTENPFFEFVQLQINYLDWESEWVKSRACYEVCVKHKKPVIVMEPVKGGTLAKVPEDAEKLFASEDPSMSVPSWAIRFAASLPNVMVVLSGMSSLDQMKDNLSFMSDFTPLTDEEKDVCFHVAKIINSRITVPCTACHYCTEGCPMNIAIPEYFSLYNEDMRENLEEKGWTINFTNYELLSEKRGKAKDCIACGQCENVCPQHLTIIDFLKDVSAHFDR